MKYGAIIHKTGGGTGYNFSQIRPEGSPVQSTDGVASGPISFIRVFNAATDVIKQGGRRRGANMGILNVWHPDILAFITMKREEGDVANFNLSVMVDDRFMDLVSGKEFETVWLVHPVTGESITVGRDLDEHRGRDLAERGAGGPLLRRDQPAQPDAAARRDRHHEPLRRAAAPPLRELRPREHQPGRLRPRRGPRPGRGRGHRTDGRPVPRPRHRPERLPDPADRGGDEAHPEDRPGGHGGPRRHAHGGSPVRLPRGPGLVRGRHASGSPRRPWTSPAGVRSRSVRSRRRRGASGGSSRSGTPR